MPSVATDSLGPMIWPRVDRVPDEDVRGAIPVAAGVAHRGETSQQAVLRALRGVEHQSNVVCPFGGASSNTWLCTSMKPGITVAWLRSIVRNPAGMADFPLRPDVGDAFAVDHDDLLGQHLTGFAVEQPTGTDRHLRQAWQRGRSTSWKYSAALDPQRERLCMQRG